MKVKNDMAIEQSDDEPLRELALFAGAGGGILGGKLLGWQTVCAVERDAYASQVLAQRQNDGILEPFPIWSDVTTFDGKTWRGIVDIVSAGFSCQPHSNAGKRHGVEDERWLWDDIFRIFCETESSFLWLENVPGLIQNGGLEQILFDVAKMGFDAEWGVVSASSIGGLTHRERVWVLIANANCKYVERGSKEKVLRLYRIPGIVHSGVDKNERGLRSIFQPGLCRSFNGLPNQVDRLRAVGNAQVPAVAATAFTLLRERLNEQK